MSRKFALALLVFGFASTAAATGQLYTSVSLDFQINIGQGWVSSLSHADYLFKPWYELTPTVGGTHTIENSNASETGSSPDGSWTSFISGYALLGECGYRGTIDAWESNNWTTQGAATGAECCPMPQCTVYASYGTGGNTVPHVQTVDCGSYVEISAYAYASYAFDHWEGAVDSTDNPLSFQVNQNPTSVTAVFVPTCDPADPSCICDPITNPNCPCDRVTDPNCTCDPAFDPNCPCDPATDPSCGCDPATDPTCGCDPVTDPTCCDPLSDPTCGCDPADPSCGGGGCDPVFDPDCCIETGTCDDNDDPVVINLSREPWRLTGANNPVLFDIHATGHKVKIGWTAPGANLAFLALDRNGNGRVDDGSELFGNATPLGNGHLAANGFEALAQYDSNHDGVINKKDAVWTSLLLWVDRNHDGVCQPGELTPISRSAITSIALTHRWTGRRDSSGNTFRYKGAVHFGRRVQSFFDILFAAVH